MKPSDKNYFKSLISNKRFISGCAVLLAVILISVSSTYSFLTATSQVVVNTFAGGAISLTLDEAKVGTDGQPTGDARVTSNSYKYAPGATLYKDPTVTVLDGSEECYVFLYIDNPLSEEYFSIDYSDEWEVIASDGDGALYVYSKTVDASDGDVELEAVFTQIEVSSDLTAKQIEDLGEEKMTIESYAVQVSGVSEETAFSMAAEYFNDAYGTSFVPDTVTVQGAYGSDESGTALETDE